MCESTEWAGSIGNSEERCGRKQRKEMQFRFDLYGLQYANNGWL